MSTGFRLTLIWLLGGTIALIAAFNWLPAVYFQGDVLPTGHDSFYHARRILDAVGDPSKIMQFDPRIHAPEGSWVPWPWGFDYLMAWFAHAAISFNENLEPLRVLVYVPAIWVFVTAALILGIAGTLGLNLRLRLVAILCFALSPLTQNLHGLGRIDHHFFEYTIVLAALFTGLRWCRNTDSRSNAALFGSVLGLACAFHNGLFVLQVPLLILVTLLWFKGTRLPPSSTVALVFSLVAATLVAVIPSGPFREGMFAYHLLSWFHLYVSGCTALLLLLLQRLEPKRPALALLTVVVLGTLTPILVELRSGLGFLGMSILELKAMPEAQSVFGGTGGQAMSWWQAWKLYSGLVLLLPAVIFASAWLAVRSSRPDRIYFYVFTVFGASLLLVQYRFHHFGSFAVYLPLLVWCQDWLESKLGNWVWSGLTALLLTAYVPSLNTLTKVPVPGYSYDYAATRSIYPSLARACSKHPGVVLADHNDGHFIRFHTDCSVIANNLILTDQSREKIRQTKELFQLKPAELLNQAPWIDFVFIRREDDVFNPGLGENEIRRLNGGLGVPLLLDAPPFPVGYHLLHQVVLKRDDGTRVAIARSFQILKK